MDTILQGLNDRQKCAVLSPSPVLQVLAPPGSGKTKTLTARVACLISHLGLKPWNIIVCTFTIKAAREMKERIRNFIGDQLENRLVLGTFHSVARRYLVAYGQHLGLPKNFGIADSSDSLAIIKRIIKRHDYHTEPSKARSRISRLKSGITTAKAPKTTADHESQEFDAIFAEYEETLRASSILDYDDLLLRCVELLKRHPECVSNIQAVLIDEFQDTNSVQYELMSLFAQHRINPDGHVPSITIVGDPDQSIYSFRSAEIKNLKRMCKQYDDTQVVYLEENYRSSGSILHAAMELIEQDETRPNKKLLSTHCPGEQPVLRTLPTSAAEAAWIVSELQRSFTLSSGLLTYSDYAILLRSASLSLQIERALGSAGIPYRMIGGLKFFDRVEVKILLDYLRVVSQPDHNDALKRVINVPSRKIGEVTVNSLVEEAETQKRTLWSLILDIAQGRRKSTTKLSSQAQKGLEAFVNIVVTAQKKISRHSDEYFTVAELIQHVLQKLSFEDYLRKSHPNDFENRWANVEELLIQATEFSTVATNDAALNDEALFTATDLEQRRLDSAEDALGKFLANVALAAAIDLPEDEHNAPNQVTISTIHAAKGLEWPVVFIPATSEGIIPHSRAEDTDEERRLLYVGMTRAQALLYLSWSKKNSRNDTAELSSFLTSSKMVKCFTIRGPSLSLPTIQDFARILRRECPQAPALQQAATSCSRLEDDLWPEDGEEIPSEVTYWQANNTSRDLFESLPTAKRQKMSSSSSTRSSFLTSQPQHSVQRTSDAQLNTGFMSARTIYKSAANSRARQPSESINTGFRSALRVYEDVSSVSKSTATTSSSIAKQTTKSILQGLKGNRRQLTGQGSIINFFNKASVAAQHTAATVCNEPHAAASSKYIAPQQPRASQASNAPIRDALKPAQPNVQERTDLLPTFAKHRPTTKSSFKPPSRVTQDVDKNPQRYILLSSSPTKVEDG